MFRKLQNQRLIKKLGLIQITPTARDFSLFIPDNHRWMFSEGDYYEANVVFWFEVLLRKIGQQRKQATFYDIGANCGYYSLLASGHVDHVQAFEPSKDSYAVSSLNIHINRRKNVTLNQVALTNSAGSVTFHTYSSSGNDSLIKRTIPKDHELKYKSTYQVTADKLDSIIDGKQYPFPDFIKVDIEGAELFALEGAKKTLQAAHNPPIIIEYSAATSQDAGYPRHHIRDFLLDMGYAVFGLDEDNKTTKLIRLSKKTNQQEAHISNLVAVNNTKASLALLEIP